MLSGMYSLSSLNHDLSLQSRVVVHQGFLQEAFQVQVSPLNAHVLQLQEVLMFHKPTSELAQVYSHQMKDLLKLFSNDFQLSL